MLCRRELCDEASATSASDQQNYMKKWRPLIPIILSYSKKKTKSIVLYCVYAKLNYAWNFQERLDLYDIEYEISLSIPQEYIHFVRNQYKSIVPLPKSR